MDKIDEQLLNELFEINEILAILNENEKILHDEQTSGGEEIEEGVINAKK